MKKYFLVLSVLLVFCFLCSDIYAQEPKGAKALFDSGEGTTVKMSSGPRVTSPAATTAKAPEKYVGISYKLVLLRDDGRFSIVPKSRTFRSGEKLKLLVRTNRPGYLTIMNVGTSGNTNVLFNDYVEAMSMQEIPKTGRFSFDSTPGTEKLLVMLSGSPNPIGSPQTTTVAQLPQGTATSSSTGYPPPPPPTTSADSSLPPPPPPATTADAGMLPPPPPAMMASFSGSKDIVIDNNQRASYGIVSPKNGWKTEPGGRKDIVQESVGGENYGVIPASYIDDGKILTLEIQLRHK